MRYYIVSGNSLERFFIDVFSGVLYVKSPIDRDPPRNEDSFLLTVICLCLDLSHRGNLIAFEMMSIWISYIIWAAERKNNYARKIIQACLDSNPDLCDTGALLQPIELRKPSKPTYCIGAGTRFSKVPKSYLDFRETALVIKLVLLFTQEIWRWNDEYMNFIYLNRGMKKYMHTRSSQLKTQLMQLQKQSLKNSGLPGFKPNTLSDIN